MKKVDEIIRKLIKIKNELYDSFPYKDTVKIQEDFREQFLHLSEDQNSLTGDFNT